jgi:hypothetical protein
LLPSDSAVLAEGDNDEDRPLIATSQQLRIRARHEAKLVREVEPLLIVNHQRDARDDGQGSDGENDADDPALDVPMLE